MEPQTVISILIMAVLVIFSAYFSATETAFTELNKSRIKALLEAGSKKAELVLALAEKQDKLIFTILIGNNIVNIVFAIIGTRLFITHYGEIGTLIAALVVTILVLVFGEISPKTLAKEFPEKFAIFSAPFLRVLLFVFAPINFIFGLWKKLLSKMFKNEEDKKMSQEELLMLVQEVEEEGSIDNDESTLLRNVIEFTDLLAEDILTHRGDVEAVSIDTSKKEIARIFSDTKFSRLPVYEETIDNIVGVIHQKDFYNAGSIFTGDIRDILSDPVFVPQSLKVDALLKELQTAKSHIAVVVDEYGGMVGIVTMEDILEELVGEIWDEHDDVIEDFKEIAPNTFRVNGLINLEDFNEFFGTEIEGEGVSFGGWVMEMLDKIPEVNDKFEFDNLEFTVTETDARRASIIEVVMHPTDKTENEEE